MQCPLLALICAVVCSTVVAQDPDLSARFVNYTVLSPSPVYELYWNVTGNRIIFAVRAETTGWVGFGISPNGLMLNSDVIMGYVDDTTGVVTFTDRKTNPSVRIMPVIDAQQDWNLVSGRQVGGGFTTLEFFRFLDTGDTAGDIIIGETVNLIWSFRTDDDTALAHTTRGNVLGVRLVPQMRPSGTITPSATTPTTANITSTPTGIIAVGDTEPATASIMTPTTTTAVSTPLPTPSPTPDVCTLTCDSPRILNQANCTCDCPTSIQPCPFGMDEFCFCRCPPGSQEACVNNATRAVGNLRNFNLFTCNCTCFPQLCGRDEEFNDDIDICRCVALPPCPEVTNTTCPSGQEFSRRTCSCQDICGITCDAPQAVDFDTCTCQCQPSPIPISEKCPPPLRFSNTSCFCECPPDLVQECPPNQVYNNFTCRCECLSPPSTCPPMFTFDTNTCECTCDTSFVCPGGQSLDTSSCECICDANPTCSSVQTFNNATCQCECNTQQECCEGRVFDEDSCSCVCANVQECSAGYIFDSKSCQCVCEGRVSEDIWHNRYRDCWRDHHKVFNIFTCGCECSRSLQCWGNRVVDPKTCRCVCPKLFCVSPKALSPYTCDCQCRNYHRCRQGFWWDNNECKCKCQKRDCPRGQKFNNATCRCESMCPHTYRGCHSGFTFDYTTCRCQCSRTCKENEVLDSRYCWCKRKQVTYPPTRSYPVAPTTRYIFPATTQPPNPSRICPLLRSASYCYRSYLYRVSCRWSGGACRPICCQPKGTRQRRTTPAYCSLYPQSYCMRSSYCRWQC